MNEINDANKQQPQQQQQQQDQQGQQVQLNHDGSQQTILQAQQNQGSNVSGAQAVTPQQTLIVNTANIAQQQQQQLQTVGIHQTNATAQQQMTIQQPQSSLAMQVPQSAANTMQTSLGSMSLQQPGATTITTMQAPPGSLAQSGANTITTMQAPLAIQQGGQTITTMQAPPGAVPLHTPQSGTTTITTMSTLQQHQQHPIQAQTPQPQQGQIQQVSDWGHGRVQVIQQPIQNPAYLQQLYNTQGQLLMPGNIALHPTGMNPAIQVITTGKTFQPNQLTPHMLQTQGKQVIAQGQPGTFPSYTIPTTTNQTLVISQLGVISSQPNILPHSAKQDMQKLQYTTCQTGRGVQQNTAQPMQFSPWQFGTSLPQGLTWAPQPPTLLTTQNPIFIRGTTQQDGTTAPQMFISSPPPQIHNQHAQGTLPNLTQIAASGGTTAVVGTKPRNSNENIQPKGNTGNVRPLSNILPSVIGPQAIRPASSAVSTQTVVAQHMTQAQMQNQKAQVKMRAKTMVQRVALAAGQKADAANQTKPQTINQQQHLAANKMILTSAGTLVASPQQLTHDKMQQQQIQQQQKVVQQQQQQLANMQQQINIQQQQITYQQQQAQQQLIQPKPPPVMVSGMTVSTLQSQQQQQAQQQLQMQQQQLQQIQQQQQQQQQITLIDRPVMPVVSMGAVQSQPQIQTVSILPCPIIKEDAPPVSGIAEEKMDTSNELGNIPSIVDGHLETIETITTSENDESGVGEGVNGVMVASGGEGGATPIEEATRERGLPKALVKPQVLTHVIEGFVIQEASEPFPVNRSSLLTELAQSARTEKENKNQLITADEPPLKKQALEGAAVGKTDLTKCELCGKMPLRLIFKKGKKFCSTVCAKRYSSSCGKKTGNKNMINTTSTGGTDIAEEKKAQLKTDKLAKSKEWGMDQHSTDMDTNDSAASGPESSLSPSEAQDGAVIMDIEDSSNSESANPATPKVNPLKWTVSDVCEFIRDLPGCCDYAEDFAIQEIDGQALMLLKEDHLMSAMSMKLGPALKICAKIDTMRTDGGNTNKSPQQPSPEK